MEENRGVIRLTALDYIKGLAGKDFYTAFGEVVGWVGNHAEHNPDAAYSAKEVAELFDKLFEMRRADKYETPAVGAAGESK